MSLLKPGVINQPNLNGDNQCHTRGHITLVIFCLQSPCTIMQATYTNKKDPSTWWLQIVTSTWHVKFEVPWEFVWVNTLTLSPLCACVWERGSIKTISVTTRCSSFRVSLSLQIIRSMSWPKEIYFADRLVIPVPCTEFCTKSFAYIDRPWNLGDNTQQYLVCALTFTYLIWHKRKDTPQYRP